jgi:putative hydrolase of the HAD superfamily
VKDFFGQQGEKHPDFAAWLSKRNLSATDWQDIEFQFIKPELDITLPLEGAPELLASLKGRYPLYLLSNNVSRVLVEKIVEKTGLSGFFDEIIVSSEVGFRKPHEQFLRATERVTGHSAGECVMIGDRLTQDIEMANQFGMLSIHVALVDHEDNAGAEHISATIKIHALEEIRTLYRSNS